MDVRTLLSVSAVLLGCSCGAPEAPVPSSGSTAPASAPADPTADPPPAPEPHPGPETAERCEGLVGACGGWMGCVTVRIDPTGPGRFVGVGPNVGHLYDENHTCLDGVCNEVCSRTSLRVCRPGVTERIPDMACSETMPPSEAPFSCEMRDGACVQGPGLDMVITS